MVNNSRVRRPKWTGQPGEVAILVARGEPTRTDAEVEEWVRDQVFAYLDEQVPDRQVDQPVRFATMHLIVADHVWSGPAVGRGPGRVLLDREHLLAYVDAAQERMDRARAAIDAARADLGRGQAQ